LKLFSHKNPALFLLMGCLFSSAWDFRVFGGEKLRAESIEKVIIDAGHGGHDPGNLGTGKYRTSEKHIALEVALRAGQLIERELRGVEVVFTRESDKFLELRERTALANKEDADLFISVHCDAFTTGSPQGSLLM
jgi:N-acetylmuramoyl-L-alanine amidase